MAFLVFFSLAIVFPYLSIVTDHTGRTITRTPWIIWCVGATAVVWAVEDVGGMNAVVIFIIYAALQIVGARLFLWRGRDAGHSDKFAFLYLVPVVNMFVGLGLMFEGSKLHGDTKSMGKSSDKMSDVS